MINGLTDKGAEEEPSCSLCWGETTSLQAGPASRAEGWRSEGGNQPHGESRGKPTRKTICHLVQVRRHPREPEECAGLWQGLWPPLLCQAVPRKAEPPAGLGRGRPALAFCFAHRQCSSSSLALTRVPGAGPPPALLGCQHPGHLMHWPRKCLGSFFLCSAWFQSLN